MKILSGSTSILKESLSDITVSEYMRLIFKNDLSVLTLSGNPSTEELEIRKSYIIYEFSVACGSNSSSVVLKSMKKSYSYSIKIVTFTLCHNLFIHGLRDEPLKVLRENGIVNAYQLKDHEVLNRFTSLISNYTMKIKEENDKMEKSKPKGEKKYKEEDFERNLAYISAQTGFKIDKKTTSLAELAAYIYNVKQKEDGECTRELNTGKSGRVKQPKALRR